jgi:hypothetical protein
MLEVPRQFSQVELWVQAALCVPPYPEPPEGSPESIQVFHAGRNYYTLCLLVWFLSQLLILIVLIGNHCAFGPKTRSYREQARAQSVGQPANAPANMSLRSNPFITVM